MIEPKHGKCTIECLNNQPRPLRGALTKGDNMKTYYINLYKLEKQKERGRRSIIHKVHCATIRDDWNLFDWEYLNFSFPNTFMMNPDSHLQRYKLSEFINFVVDSETLSTTESINSPKYLRYLKIFSNKKSSHYNLPFLEGYHIPENTFSNPK